MRIILFILCLPLGLFAAQNRFVVVIPSYNNEAYCEANLSSVFRQTYPHYRVIYIDDCSSDHTYENTKTVVEKWKKQAHVTLIRNEQRRLALENLYDAIHTCADDEIIVVLDGDDWFYDEDVLSTLNQAYAQKDVWLTYGSYIYYPSGEKGASAQPISYPIIHSNTIRKRSHKRWVLSHLKTFYAKLFKQIASEDLKQNGSFLPSAYDFAMMIPMVEMAGIHTRFIQKILYVYNRSTPINDDKVRAAIQDECKRYVLSLPPYQPLDELFLGEP